ncbi:MAG TPA: electron transport complex subunit RsxA [Lachnospiraceae bacterium]|nr:RnfABCDGE type electron transport complex subunit A [Eubacterium sp.]HAK58323.1 electron transport complex subunit RsxA [Lachnospiraceae bacterium]
MTLFTILFTAALVNNFVLSQFLGICPFLGVSKKVQTAAGMGGAVIFVITIASLITSTLYNLLLKPNDLEYLNTIVFILVIAALVQFVEMFMKKSMKGLYQALGVYLPLITTNCAVLGVALLSVQYGDNILEATIRGLGASVGFFLAMVLMAGIREKLENSNIPSAMKGTPIVLVTAGLMAIAFCGFGGVSF